MGPEGGPTTSPWSSGLIHADPGPGWCRSWIPEYPDECAFGLADLGFGTPESGSIGLLELTEYRGPFGLGIERDIHFTASYPLSIYAEAARAAGHIVESGPELEAAARILIDMPADAAGSAKPANRPRRTGTVSGRTAFHRPATLNGGTATASRPRSTNPARAHAGHRPARAGVEARAGAKGGPSEGAVRAGTHPSHLPAWSMP